MSESIIGNIISAANLDLVNIKSDYLPYLLLAIRAKSSKWTHYLANLETEGIGGYQLLYQTPTLPVQLTDQSQEFKAVAKVDKTTSDMQLSSEDWDFYFSCVDTDYKGLVACIINYEFSTLAALGINNAMDLDRAMTADDVLDLYNLSVDAKNFYASEILQAYIEVAPPANIPIWMIPTKIHSTRMDHQDLYQLALDYANAEISKPLTIETLKSAISVMSKLSGGLDFELSQVVQIPPEYQEMYKRLALATDITLLKLVGPVNLIPEIIFDLDDPCTKLGGCRMLTCMHVDNTDDDDTDVVIDFNDAPEVVNKVSEIKSENIEDQILTDEEDDWFCNQCMITGNVIANRSQAIRIPLVAGGWYGCYSNEVAVRTGLRERFSQADETIIGDTLITDILGQLNKTGIFDLGSYEILNLFLNYKNVTTTIRRIYSDDV